MPTATKPNARELRKQAKSLGVADWEDMSLSELQAAIKEAEDSDNESSSNRRTRRTNKQTGSTPVSSKTPKQKAAAKAKSNGSVDVAENGNPYKEGSNLWYITEELIKGGQRAAMVKRLKKKIELKPRNAGDDWDEDYELDRRILITGQILRRDHGFEVERGGRGAEDGTIKATAG